LNIGSEKRFSSHSTLTALGWVWQEQPTYAFEGIINFTGATIAWLRDQLQLIANPAETEALSQSVSDSDGVYFIPAFVGLSAPYWRSDARAAILGMTPSTTRAHIVRAAVESIGYIVTDVLKAMGADAGIKLGMVHADGGAVRNAFLMQFVADMNQLQVRAAQTPELSALGAVYSGCLGLKIYTSLEDLQKLPVGFTEYTPSMEAADANKLFAGWQKAVQQVLYQPQ
jgi:glycerol kinase